MSRVRAQARRYPELLRFPSEQEASRALRDWSRQMVRTWHFWLGMLAYGSAAGLAVAFLPVLISRWVSLPPSMWGGFIGGVVGGSSAGAMTLIWRRRYRQFLRRQLVAAGVPICIPCGYDVRGLTEPRCPECGAAFDPHLLGSAAEAAPTNEVSTPRLERDAPDRE